MSNSNYLEECMKDAFLEANIKATDEQIKNVSNFICIAYENFSMYMGYDNIPNRLKLENEKLKKELELEKRKEICNNCNGTGQIIIEGPYHSTEHMCIKCNGKGKI